MFNTSAEVRKMIRTEVLKALKAYIPNETWDCMEYAQATFQNADRIVTMLPVRTKRLGFGHISYDRTGKRNDEWLEQEDWQLQVILARRTSNGNLITNKYEAQDIVSMLITWFNKKGNHNLRLAGVANLPIDTSDILVYNDDSDVYQKRAVFMLRLQVPQSFTYEQSYLTKVSGEIHSV